MADHTHMPNSIFAQHVCHMDFIVAHGVSPLSRCPIQTLNISHFMS